MRRKVLLIVELDLPAEYSDDEDVEELVAERFKIDVNGKEGNFAQVVAVVNDYRWPR